MASGAHKTGRTAGRTATTCSKPPASREQQLAALEAAQAADMRNDERAVVIVKPERANNSYVLPLLESVQTRSLWQSPTIPPDLERRLQRYFEPLEVELLILHVGYGYSYDEISRVCAGWTASMVNKYKRSVEGKLRAGLPIVHPEIE